MPRAFPIQLPMVRNEVEWMPHYPNPADFRFDYYELLHRARMSGSGIGEAPEHRPRVAIVGAGVAGLTAARELFRCGYRVRIYEASARIGGRHWTVSLGEEEATAMEMGAMRFPYFGGRDRRNCLFDYYLTAEMEAPTSPFPNPGTAEGGTGIYLNGGRGPGGVFDPPRLIDWPAGEDSYNPPQDPTLTAVYDKVHTFITFFTDTVSPLYTRADWPETWRRIAGCYEQMTFSDLVFAAPATSNGGDGWLGGFGMTQEESALFYTIGAGDGSWGAFYEIGAMWFIRCVMFGFNDTLQTVAGPPHRESLPWYGQPVSDSAGRPFQPPVYQGIQALDEWLLFQRAPGAARSLYEAIREGGDSGAELYVSRAVTGITKLAGGAAGEGASLRIEDETGEAWECDHAVVTPVIWASQLSIALEGFDCTTDLPWSVVSARNAQHIISSGKVFFPLRSTYWKESSIPQILVTDTLVQDAYGMKWSEEGNGVLLASYTWEDDASKLLALDEASVKKLVLDTLDQVTGSTVGEKISDYVVREGGVVFQWSLQPTYSGCAKLYRQRNWEMNYDLLAYNQEHGASSRMYFAGESYSVEGGWTEPAQRLALDAVIRLIHDSGGSFHNGFGFSDYPRFDTGFAPPSQYPPGNIPAAR